MKDWQKQINLIEPDENRVCHRCANVDVEDQASETRYWYYCGFAVKKFEKTSNYEIKQKYRVSGEGWCEHFKKVPRRCPDYLTVSCERRNCHKKGYDDDCMEIIS